VRKSNTGLFAQLVSDARAAEWETITAADEQRLFYRMAWWKKVVVMAGGPTVNLLIAFFIFAGLFATYGNPGDEVIHPTVSKVEACVVPAAEDGRVCKPSDPVSPAYQAGLKAGDRFVSFNGTPVSSWGAMQTLIRDNANGAATIVVDRGGRQLTLHTNTMVTPRPTDARDPEKLTPVGFLGVSPVVTYTTGGPLYTIQAMGGLAKQSGEALVTLPVKVWGVAEAIAGVKPRAQNSPVSVVGGGRIAG
jgi:membrane-associated protease RseP (regulator of RpoE activity)